MNNQLWIAVVFVLASLLFSNALTAAAKTTTPAKMAKPKVKVIKLKALPKI